MEQSKGAAMIILSLFAIFLIAALGGLFAVLIAILKTLAGL